MIDDAVVAADDPRALWERQRPNGEPGRAQARLKRISSLVGVMPEHSLCPGQDRANLRIPLRPLGTARRALVGYGLGEGGGIQTLAADTAREILNLFELDRRRLGALLRPAALALRVRKLPESKSTIAILDVPKRGEILSSDHSSRIRLRSAWRESRRGGYLLIPPICASWGVERIRHHGDIPTSEFSELVAAPSRTVRADP